MPDDHIVRHEIDRYYDATSAVCIKRESETLLCLQCDTMSGVRVMISFEGGKVRDLKRAVDRAFAQHPEMLEWE